MLFGSVQRLKTHGKLLQVLYEGHTIILSLNTSTIEQLLTII